MNKVRFLHYDYMRVWAMISIVAIHALGIVLSSSPNFNTQWWYANLLNIIFRIGLPLFFMISGALLINGKYNGLIDFYFRRLSKVALPLILYSFIYLFTFRYKFEIFTPHNLISSFGLILSGPVYTHFWFIYVIIGVYILVPFLRIMLVNLSDRLLLGLIIILIAVKAISIYLPLAHLNIGVYWLFSGWEIYFIMGYALARSYSQKIYNVINFLAIISFLMTVIILRFFPALQINLFDLAPTMIMMSGAMFSLFFRFKDKINKISKGSKLITFLALRSYSVFLIHPLCLFLINQKLISSLSFGYAIGFPLVTMLTLTTSIASTLIIDDLIVKPISLLAQLLFNSIKKLVLRKQQIA